MERKFEYNNIGSMNIIPNDFKFIHLTEDIKLVLTADGKPHTITIFAKTDTNLRRYNVDINKKALYDEYGISVQNFRIDGNTIVIVAFYSIYTTDLICKRGLKKCKHDNTSLHNNLIVTIDNDTISHIAVGEPLSKSNKLEIHYKDEDNRLVDIICENNILNFVTRKDIAIGTEYLYDIIDLNIDIGIPDNHVLQVFNSNESIKTGIHIYNGSYNILDGDNIKLCLKWAGNFKTIKENNYEISKNLLGQIIEIIIPAGTTIAKAIMIENKPILLSFY